MGRIFKLIVGHTCPACGRDNSEYGSICTSDDCPAVQMHDAAPELLEALESATKTLEEIYGFEADDSEYIATLRATIARAKGEVDVRVEEFLNLRSDCIFGSGDRDISTATDVIEDMMEEMEDLEASLAGAEGYR